MTTQRRRASRQVVLSREIGNRSDQHERRVQDLELQLYHAPLHIKVFMDDEIVEAGDGAFCFYIPVDMDELEIVRAECFVSTAGTGSTTVQIRNETQGHDLLSTAMTIESGERTTKTSATPGVVNEANAVIAWGDLLWVDVDAAASGAMGLGVTLSFV